MKLFLVGGFLGSGKTTAIQKASTLLLEGGTKVGVIANDQGDQLVDNRFISSFGVPTREVTNGCFCCRFDQLEDGVEGLAQLESTEVVFAESVGSCTDLIATIVNPFSRSRPDLDIIVSVFVDARVLATIINGSRLFAPSVNYIYRKQIEEGDVLVVNKIDLLNVDQLAELAVLLEKNYPNKVVTYQNSLDKRSIINWLRSLDDFDSKTYRVGLDLDYDLYGAGEAALAWLDHEVLISTKDKKGVRACTSLINNIYSKINELKIPIGHLKFYLDTGKGQQKISFTAINESLTLPQLQIEESQEVQLLINARVETQSEVLKKVVEGAIDELLKNEDCKVAGKQVLAFHPGYPKPTHRIMQLD